jgi:hypothetical protein
MHLTGDLHSVNRSHVVRLHLILKLILCRDVFILVFLIGKIYLFIFGSLNILLDVLNDLALGILVW